MGGGIFDVPVRSDHRLVLVRVELSRGPRREDLFANKRRGGKSLKGWAPRDEEAFRQSAEPALKECTTLGELTGALCRHARTHARKTRREDPPESEEVRNALRRLRLEADPDARRERAREAWFAKRRERRARRRRQLQAIVERPGLGGWGRKRPAQAYAQPTPVNRLRGGEEDDDGEGGILAPDAATAAVEAFYTELYSKPRSAGDTPGDGTGQEDQEDRDGTDEDRTPSGGGQGDEGDEEEQSADPPHPPPGRGDASGPADSEDPGNRNPQTPRSVRESLPLWSARRWARWPGATRDMRQVWRPRS